MKRTPLRRTTAALTALLLAGALAACGGDEPAAAPSEPTTTASEPTDTASESPSDPTEDGRISGEGYTYAVPDGWQDGTEQFQAMSSLMDSGALDSETSGGFADNINVIRNDTYPEMSLEEAEQQFAAEAGTVSKKVKVRDRSEIGGEPAIHISGVTPMAKAKVRTEQYSLYREGAWYIVTFSFGQDTPLETGDAEMASVLDAWEWS